MDEVIRRSLWQSRCRARAARRMFALMDRYIRRGRWREAEICLYRAQALGEMAYVARRTAMQLEMMSR